MKKLKYELKEVKTIFLYSLLAFLMIGFLSALILRNQQETIEDLMFKFIGSKGDLITASGEILVWELFKNNLKAALLSYGLGFIPFLFLPALSLVTNSLILGAAYVFTRPLMGAFSFVAALLPHGILEIPAFLLAVSLGLYFCGNLNKKILRRNHRSLRELVKGHLLIFILLITPLLMVAAIIESYISPVIMNFLIG